MATPEQREAVIAGLREAADFLEAHPELPVSRHWILSVHTLGEFGLSDAEGTALVNEAARVLNRNPSGTAHYRATRRFGGIAYEVLRISEADMGEHRAKQSYTRNIQVDEGGEQS